MSQNSKHVHLEKDIEILKNAWREIAAAFCSSNKSLSSCAFGQPTRGFSQAINDEQRAYKRFSNVEKKFCKKYSVSSDLEVDAMINMVLLRATGQEVA